MNYIITNTLLYFYILNKKTNIKFTYLKKIACESNQF